MKITIKLSETNNALLNRVVKEEKVDASEFANNAFLDKFLPVSEKLGIEAGFILQEHEAGTLNAWLVKQSISRGIRWLGKHPIRDCAILRQILGRFPFGADDNGKISTCNECVQSDMDSVVALLKERVPGYVPAKDEYNGLVEDVLAAIYKYLDKNGELVAEKVRYTNKTFFWRSKKPDGSYDYHKLESVPLYNGAVLEKAEAVFLVEGEKDVDTLTKHGLPAVSLLSDFHRKSRDFFRSTLAQH